LPSPQADGHADTPDGPRRPDISALTTAIAEAVIEARRIGIPRAVLLQAVCVVWTDADTLERWEAR